MIGTVIQGQDSRSTVHERQTVIRINSLEKDINLRHFIVGEVESKRGDSLQDIYKRIVSQIKEATNVWASTKAALSASSLETSRKIFVNVLKTQSREEGYGKGKKAAW